MSKENVEVARRYAEAFNAHGLDGTTHLRHADWELFDPPEFPDADRYVGEEARSRVESFLKDMGWDGKFRVLEYVDAGDEVIMVWRATGEVPLGKFPLDQTFSFLSLFENGKLRRVRAFLTKDQALEAAGLSE